MKKILLLSFLLFFTSNAFAVELLVRAKAHYMDSYNQTQIDKMSESEKQSYEARSQIGDIIAIYPDGTCKEKPAPDSAYAIVKIPGVTIEEANKYKDQLQDTKEVTREMTLPKSEYDELVKDGKLTEKAITLNYAKVPSIVSSKSVESKGKSTTEYTINATTNQQYLKRRRKYQIPKSVMNKIGTGSNATLTVESKDKDTFMANIVDKTKASE